MRNLTAIIIIIFFGLISCTEQREYFSVKGATQGTSYHITYFDKEKKDLRKEIEDVLLRVDSLFSIYKEESVVSKFNREGEIICEDTLFLSLLKESNRLSKETLGAFDITYARLFELWGFGKREREHAPSTDSVTLVLESCGSDKIEITKIDKRDSLAKESKGEDSFRIKRVNNFVTLNFNAIAQGLTCDLIGDMFVKLGVVDFMIEVGGEVLCKGENPKGKKWRIAIDKPIDGNFTSGEIIESVEEIEDMAIVTSGNYRKFYNDKGVKIRHTINTKTGMPSQSEIVSATVITKKTFEADAIATASMVWTLEENKEFFNKKENSEKYLVILMYKENLDSTGKFKIWRNREK